MTDTPPPGFQDLNLRDTYSPDDEPFETFYVPTLARAVSYARAVGYWSAAELRYASQGVAHFLANGGRMRLVVGAQLGQGDVDAVLAGEPLDQMLVRRLLADPGLAGAQIVRDQLLRVLAWMVKDGRLEIRVGVPTENGRLLTHQESGRYFHTKFGILTDGRGDRVAFNGSNNASVTAWARNHETFDVFHSWVPAVWDRYGQPKVDDFDQLWSGSPDPGWAVVDLPEAVRQHLIEYAPDEAPLPPGTPMPPQDDPKPEPKPAADEPASTDEAWAELVALASAPAERDWTAVGTAQVVPLPHQARLVDRVVSTFPRGYLLADEVGLGKTVEAGLALRELMLSGAARNALLLVPASVMVQWQEELHEKLSLDVVRYDKGVFVDRHGNELTPLPGSNPWSAYPIVLASSHLARRKSRRAEVLAAGPWDVVLVDEAHHARRRGSKATDQPNSLLSLLIEMRDRKLWKAIYLASATPMQMNPHEAWDLISLLGLRGAWAESAMMFMRYFESLRNDPKVRDWSLLARMLGDYFDDQQAERDQDLAERIDTTLGFVDAYSVTNLNDAPPSSGAIAQMPNLVSHYADLWLRRHTPMRDRVFRNTRKTLRAYQKAGIIPPDVVIPVRTVHDVFIPLADNERRLYERIENYIRRHYNAYMTGASQQALGFIMTVYRRRLTSSFAAITKSLQRRLDTLENRRSLDSLLTDDDRRDLEDTLFDPEAFDVSSERLQDEIGELRSFVHQLEQISAEDTKATQLIDDIRASVMKGYSSVVVFTQYTDTMEYVRERLLAAQITKIGCYSGRGGEIWNPETKVWDRASKSEIKTAFRAGQLDALIGTDSMSEGLNLQTSGRLINYDMPWNLMRVEQRIGRVDRIGASYADIEVSNYFYADTVEEQVYKGIKEDYGDFTDIMGEASPVLATVEKQIEQLALGDSGDQQVHAAVNQIRKDAADLQGRAVQADDLGTPDEEAVKEPPHLVGSVDLAELERILTSNALTAGLFTAGEVVGTYELVVPGSVPSFSLAPSVGVSYAAAYSGESTEPRRTVTFDRAVAEDAPSDVVFLTYGTPELDALLPAATATTTNYACSSPADDSPRDSHSNDEDLL